MPYRVQIRAGAHSWTIDEDAAADFGPLADLSIGWEADLDYMIDNSGPVSLVPGGPYTHGDDFIAGFPSQVKPWRARVGIITETAAEVGDLAVDDPVWIRYRHTTAGAVAVEFTGRIRELTQTPHERGAVTWLTCADYTIDTQSRTFDPGVGFDAWLTPMTLAQRLAKVHDFSPYSGQPAWTYEVLSGSLASPDYPGSVYDAARAIWAAAGNLFTYTTDPATGELVAYTGLELINGTFGSPLRLDAAGVITGGIDGCAVPREDIEWRRTWFDVTDETLPYFGTTPAGWDIAEITYRNPDPAVMAGWFTLPDAMSQLVAISGIEERWHPEGKTYWGGRPVAAEFRILSGGVRTVTLTLTRRMPDPNTTHPISAADNPDAITWAELPVGFSWDELPVGLTWDDLNLIGA